MDIFDDMVDLPSGKRVQKNYGKIHHWKNGQIHYFDWAIFNSKLSHITRGYTIFRESMVFFPVG